MADQPKPTPTGDDPAVAALLEEAETIREDYEAIVADRGENRRGLRALSRRASAKQSQRIEEIYPVRERKGDSK